jgi:hypothetical protein
MHIGIALFTVLASIKWADWKRWRQFHASMIFIAAGGFLYEYIVADYTLWKFYPSFLLSERMTVILYAVLTMPLSILLFLQHFPDTLWRQLRYILMWSMIYISGEAILLFTNSIAYEHGWHFWYSLMFDIVLFTVIAIHHTHPARAYLLSIPIIIFLIHYFNVPFHAF